ncbi:MAG TPA: hypothetical protein DD437_07930 [Rhodobiaceae bacterium]|nr:hypothetical protein [Rhodobiaceae bacterium]
MQYHRERHVQSQYYPWSMEFMEAGKKRLTRDTTREADGDEVAGLRKEVRDLKKVVANQALERRLLKKNVIGDGERTNEALRNRETRDLNSPCLQLG